MKIINKIILLIIIMSSFGCTTLHKGPYFDRLEETQDNQAIVYVYRIGVMPFLSNPKIIFNDYQTMLAKEKSYSYFRLPPGAYNIKVKWSVLNPGMNYECQLTVEPGKKYFLKLTSQLGGEQYRTENFIVYKKSSCNLVLLHEDDAKREMKHTMYIEPLQQ